MVTPQSNRHYWIYSLVFHIVIVLVLVIEFDHTSLSPVFENTNQTDVISAVVLGDTKKSKILPKQITAPKPLAKIEKSKPILDKPKPVQNDAIPLKKMSDKKKLAEQKILEAIKKQRKLFGKDLLADIKTENNKQKIKQKKLQSQFQKTLHEQAEQSLRQQLLDEEIKLKGTQSRQSQGEVNKYKALILQAISEQWLVPLQANKKLYCELMIRLGPGGVVLDVQITKTSGDPSLDSSARMAVLKASPLPVPGNPDAFSAFRQFVLKVKPENILES